MAKAKTGKVRTTIFAEPTLITDYDHIARTEAVNQGKNISRTDIVTAALVEYKVKWEKKNGPIPVK